MQIQPAYDVTPKHGEPKHRRSAQRRLVSPQPSRLAFPKSLTAPGQRETSTPPPFSQQQEYCWGTTGDCEPRFSLALLETT